jgi:hypothetical protein
LASSYESALYYVKTFNWTLVPIPPGTKNPTTPGWNIAENAIQTEEDAKFWIDHPDWNMGLLLSESRIVALDVDNLQNTQLALLAMGLDYDKLLENTPRIVGRPGRDKALFLAPPDIVLSRKTLAWENKETGKSEVVFELRAGAIQDVLPPSIHPDTKLPYKWKSYPSDGIQPLPKELLTIWKEWDKFKPQLLAACPWAKVSEPAPPKKIRTVNKKSEDVIGAYNDSNNIESLLEHYGYRRRAGNRYLSPYSTSGLAGVVVYPNENRIFSHHASEPFDTSHSLDAFDLFCHFEHKGNVGEAVKAAAKILKMGPSIQWDPEEIEHGKSVFQSWNKVESIGGEKIVKTPQELLSVPGILQDVVDYYNTTAPKLQPQFAVQCALALGSVVMGRRFITDQRNYSSLYFVNVGKSSTGKEHTKTVIEELLFDAGLDALIGPSGYTSSGGVLSSLIEHPCHVSVIDELGRLMESTKHSKSSNGMDAQTMIMEAFGRLDGVLRSQGYSTMTANAKNKETGPRYVKHPALTIIAMTTPSTLYSALSSKYIESGFIPRFIIVETEIGRRPSRKIVPTSPSERLLTWMRKCARSKSSEENNIDDLGPLLPPDPITIPFDTSCEKTLEEYDIELLKNMDNSEYDKMDVMFGRSKEIAQRVALILAVSCGSEKIMPLHLDWAINYIRFYNNQTVTRLKSVMSDSDFEAVCKEVFEIIERAGSKGATDREISRECSLMRARDKKERTKVMETLEDDRGIQLCDIHQKGAGRKRTAWVIEEICNAAKEAKEKLITSN